MTQLSLFGDVSPITREEAIELLTPFIGLDLRSIADRYGVTQPGETPTHTGWAGHTVEWMLGRAPNNLQEPDFGSWELKVIAVDHHPQGYLSPRAPMSLTQVQLRDLRDLPFHKSHLFLKVQHLLIPCRRYEGREELSSRLVKLCTYDLSGDIIERLQAEYEGIQWSIRESGMMGIKDVHTSLLGLQPSEGGKGWRFFARKSWVEEMIK